MSNLFLTLVIAFVVIVLTIACLAIGWLIKGRTKIVQSEGNLNQLKSEKTDSACLNCQIDPSINNKTSNDKF